MLDVKHRWQHTQNGTITKMTLRLRTAGVARELAEACMAVVTGSKGVGEWEVGKEFRGPLRQELERLA